MIIQRNKILSAADIFVDAIAQFKEAKTDIDYMRCIRTAGCCVDMTRAVLKARGQGCSVDKNFPNLEISALLMAEAEYLLLSAIQDFKNIRVSESYLEQEGYHEFIKIMNSSDPLGKGE